MTGRRPVGPDRHLPHPPAWLPVLVGVLATAWPASTSALGPAAPASAVSSTTSREVGAASEVALARRLDSSGGPQVVVSARQGAGSAVSRVTPRSARALPAGGPAGTAGAPRTNAFPVPRPFRASFSDDWHACRDGCRRRHEGNDIMADEGAPIVAVEAGRIAKIDGTDDSNGGLSVWLVGDSGVAYWYAHNSSNVVTIEERVARNQVIGRVGHTGNARSTPPHIHFQVNRCGALSSSEPCTVDPYDVLRSWEGAPPTGGSPARALDLRPHQDPHPAIEGPAPAPGTDDQPPVASPVVTTAGVGEAPVDAQPRPGEVDDPRTFGHPDGRSATVWVPKRWVCDPQRPTDPADPPVRDDSGPLEAADAPGGSTIPTGCLDVVCVWDGETGVLLDTVRPDRHAAGAFAGTHPDDRTVVVVSWNGAARTWDTASMHWIDVACEIGRRNLTHEERRNGPGEPSTGPATPCQRPASRSGTPRS